MAICWASRFPTRLNEGADSLAAAGPNRCMNHPIEHPSAWNARELVARPEWSTQLSHRETEELISASAALEAAGRPIEFDGVLPALPELQSKLRQVQHDLEHGSGVVRIQGFPAEEVTVEVAKRAFWTLCRHIGTPVSQSASGERIFSVRDASLANNDPRARGPNTRKKLSFHTDRCDVIGFLCYRQAKRGGMNEIVSSPTLYNTLLRERPDLVEVLMQSYLFQRHNVDTGNARPYVQQPVFSVHEGHFAANLLRVLIDRAYAMPDTPEMSPIQREALDVLEQTAERTEFRVAFRQQPGDILFLNNFVTFHRRSQFVDHEEPARRRHLLRVWLSVPNSRPLDPRFAGNYGSTRAGAIRGGMQPAAK